MIDKTLKPYSDNWPLLLEASRVDDEHLYAAALAVLRYAKPSNFPGKTTAFQTSRKKVLL